jgi:hypothetical protein
VHTFIAYGHILYSIWSFVFKQKTQLNCKIVYNHQDLQPTLQYYIKAKWTTMLTTLHTNHPTLYKKLAENTFVWPQTLSPCPLEKLHLCNSGQQPKPDRCHLQNGHKYTSLLKSEGNTRGSCGGLTLKCQAYDRGISIPIDTPFCNLIS